MNKISFEYLKEKCNEIHNKGIIVDKQYSIWVSKNNKIIGCDPIGALLICDFNERLDKVAKMSIKEISDLLNINFTDMLSVIRGFSGQSNFFDNDIFYQIGIDLKKEFCWN